MARRADVQISSIYQYFPSKAHIIRELAKRNLAKVRLLLQDEVRRLLAEFRDRPPVGASVNRLVDAYFAHYRDQPAALAVWAGAQSDHGLRELDLEDTRSTAEFLVTPLQRILGRDERDVLYPLALLVSEVTGAAGPDIAVPLYEAFLDALRAHGVRVETGRFGADMQVELVNDGPVTLILDTP